LGYVNQCLKEGKTGNELAISELKALHLCNVIIVAVKILS